MIRNRRQTSNQIEVIKCEELNEIGSKIVGSKIQKGQDPSVYLDDPNG
jgi:hypothetical protein